MAVALHSMASPCLYPLTGDFHSSFSCMTMVFVGLRPQSTGRPNLPVEFHDKMHRSMKSCFRNKKATNVRIKMMQIGTPRVPYITPGEGTWQWVDLWNALCIRCLRQTFAFASPNASNTSTVNEGGMVD